MSYCIIFQTKMVKLPDGRILHLTRQGCNNDNQGRKRDDFAGTIRSEEETESFIRKYETDFADVEIKINGKMRNGAAYAKHLRNALKRAVDWDTLAKTNHACAIVTCGVDVTEIDGKPCSRSFSIEEFRKFFHEHHWDSVKYYYDRSFLYDLDEIIRFLDAGAGMKFFVSSASQA